MQVTGGTATRNELVAAIVRYEQGQMGVELTDGMWANITVRFSDTPRTSWAYRYVALATTGYAVLPV